MQLTGGQFSENTAIFGNDLNTLPDFPAEIRAPWHIIWCKFFSNAVWK